MLGYITLQSVPPLGQASLAKQAQVRHQIKCVCRYRICLPACPACLSQCLTSQEISGGRGVQGCKPKHARLQRRFLGPAAVRHPHQPHQQERQLSDGVRLADPGRSRGQNFAFFSSSFSFFPKCILTPNSWARVCSTAMASSRPDPTRWGGRSKTFRTTRRGSSTRPRYQAGKV